MTGVSSRPSSRNRIPSAFVCTPTRWSADTAFGDVYTTRACESSSMTPSPTRGASSGSGSSVSNGYVPAAIIRANRLKMPTYVRSSSPGGRPKVSADSRVRTPITWPSNRTGMARTRTSSLSAGMTTVPSTISPSRWLLTTTGRSSSATMVPTQSLRYTVCVVAGRICPRTTNRAESALRSGA